MPIFFNLILIFLQIYILAIFLSLSGYLFRKGFVNHKYKQGLKRMDYMVLL